MLERLFKLSDNGTNVRTEIIAGVTTFLTMAYIIFVKSHNLLSINELRPAPYLT